MADSKFGGSIDLYKLSLEHLVIADFKEASETVMFLGKDFRNHLKEATYGPNSVPTLEL